MALMKVARTIADRAGVDRIEPGHVTTATHYRPWHATALLNANTPHAIVRKP